MKKTIAIILTILSFILILDSMNAGHAIAMFLLAGIVPGTNIVMNADQMLELSAILIGFVVARTGAGMYRAIASYNNEQVEAARTQA